MGLLTAAEYSAVRAALDIQLTEDDLPDSVIEQPIYSGSAELEVLARVADAESKTGQAKRHLRNAVILLTAALIAPAMPNLTSENIGSYQYSRAGVDWLKRAEELRARGELELARVEEADATTPTRPTLFATVAGRRGG